MKKIIAFLITVLMLMSLSACGVIEGYFDSSRDLAPDNVEENLSEIESVESVISEYISSDEFKNLNKSQKIEALKSQLYSIDSLDSYIDTDSIFATSTNLSYEYHSGIKFNFAFATDNTHLANGTNYSSVENTNSDSCVDSDKDAILLYGWDDHTSIFTNYGKWVSLMDNLKSQGFNVKTLISPTIEVLKTALLNQEVVIVAEHGANINQKMESMYSISIYGEERTFKNMHNYYSDLALGFVECINIINEDGFEFKTYLVKPSFFEFYYKENRLSNATIFHESCYGFGEYNNPNEDFANAYMSCGVSAVYGYENPVLLDYAYEFTNSIITHLSQGDTYQDSFNSARNEVGIDHTVYMDAHSEIWHNTHEYNTFSGINRAIPKLVYNKNIAPLYFAPNPMTSTTDPITANSMVDYLNISFEKIQELFGNDYSIYEMSGWIPDSDGLERVVTYKNGETPLEFQISFPSDATSFTINSNTSFGEIRCSNVIEHDPVLVIDDIKTDIEYSDLKQKLTGTLCNGTLDDEFYYVYKSPNNIYIIFQYYGTLTDKTKAANIYVSNYSSNWEWFLSP